MEDPLREDINHNIAAIRYGWKDGTDKEGQTEKGEVNVRMVTGDHLATAKCIAVQVGIISEEE